MRSTLTIGGVRERIGGSQRRYPERRCRPWRRCVHYSEDHTASFRPMEEEERGSFDTKMMS